MPLDLQQIINSTKGLRLVSALARMAPPGAGRLLARLIADQMSARKGSPVVRAVRSNQWVARGGTLGGQALDQAVRDTFRQSARCIFDLYHNVQDPDAAGKLIVLDRTAERLVGRTEFEDCGLIVAGLHLSNFDLCLQWMCKQRMQAMELTIPQPKGGRRLALEKRLQTGMNLVPA